MKLNQNCDYTKTQISYARNFVDWTGHDKAVMDADRRTRLHHAIDRMARRHTADPDVQRLLRVHRSLDRVLDREEREEPEESASASEEPESAEDALEDHMVASLQRDIARRQRVQNEDRGRSRMSHAMDSGEYNIPYTIRHPDGRIEHTMCRRVTLEELRGR